MSRHILTRDGVVVYDYTDPTIVITPPIKPPVTPPSDVHMLPDGVIPAPTAGGSGKYTYQANVTYAFAWPANGVSLEVDTSSGAANAHVETAAAQLAANAETMWNAAKTSTYSVANPAGGFPMTYQPYAQGLAQGASVGVGKPPANCIPPFPTPYVGMFRMNETGEAIVQFALGQK